MRLSWEKAIRQIPPDIMFTFRNVERKDSIVAHQDMRQVRFVDIDTQQFITKAPFEIRSERFEMKPIENISILAGKKQIKIKWGSGVAVASPIRGDSYDNPFITGYTILRSVAQDSILASGEHLELVPYAKLEPNVNQFIDTDVIEEATYTYQISVRFKTGAELKSKLFTVTVLPVIKETLLLQSYPNPFNPETWIPYELEQESDIVIEIYNVGGRLIYKLDLGVQPRGRYISKEKAAHWDGRTKLGERVSSGIYFYMLKTDNFTATRKMVIEK